VRVSPSPYQEEKDGQVTAHLSMEKVLWGLRKLCPKIGHFESQKQPLKAKLFVFSCSPLSSPGKPWTLEFFALRQAIKILCPKANHKTQKY
jgi:hypothetical protein